MKNWQCSKCGVHVTSEQRPCYSECPKSGHHQWVDLGKVGSNNYQCTKCSVLIKSDMLPPNNDCPSGGFHRWQKL